MNMMNMMRLVMIMATAMIIMINITKPSNKPANMKMKKGITLMRNMRENMKKEPMWNMSPKLNENPSDLEEVIKYKFKIHFY